MGRRRTALPPLDTLVFFEAVARRGGFTAAAAAAAELLVSQAAVSKRVRQLEDWLGTELFHRSPRSLTPTRAGATLVEPVTMALDYLRGALSDVRAPARGAVRIAANGAVATFWLAPRLWAFAL